MDAPVLEIKHVDQIFAGTAGKSLDQKNWRQPGHHLSISPKDFEMKSASSMA